MKSRKYKIITGFLLLGWMVAIFYFSNQPSVESSELSGGLSYNIVSFFNNTFSLNMSPEAVLERAADIEYPIRKLAHMTEYAILTIFAYLHFRGIWERSKKLFGIAMGGTFLYAASDEFHQLFVAGRSAQFKDVCIDCLGGFLGLLIFFGISSLILKKKRKR